MKTLRLAVVCCLLLTFIVFPFQTPNAENGRGKCRVPSAQEAYKNSKAVFVGEITGVVEENDVKTFTFKVEKYWKGANAEQIKISVRQTMRYQAWFEVGEKYLVYARGGEKEEKLWETRCSRTKSLTDAAADIEELGRAKTPIKK